MMISITVAVAVTLLAVVAAHISPIAALRAAMMRTGMVPLYGRGRSLLCPVTVETTPLRVTPISVMVETLIVIICGVTMTVRSAVQLTTHGVQDLTDSCLLPQKE